MIEEATQRPVLGVLPWLSDLWLDSEDTLDLDGRGAQDHDGAVLKVTVVRLSRISDFTDVDALAAEPNVDVAFTVHAEGLRDADLVVLPGSRATFDDLAWLPRRGLEAALVERHRGGPDPRPRWRVRRLPDAR